MDFALDGDQELIVQTLRKFSERELRGWAADADRAGAPPERLLATATDLGFCIDAVPARFDGILEGEYSHLSRALRGYELARGCPALAALLETNVEPALAVGRWGSKEVQAELYESLGGGLAALAHDSRDLLEIVEDGGGLRVTGKLGPVPALAVAAHVLIVARDAVFLAATKDMARTPITPSGWRAAQWATAELSAHAVPATYVLARGEAARDAGRLVLSWARTSLAARAAGTAAAAMEHAHAYAQERIQFGQPIGQFESLIRLHDDAVTTTAAARLFALHAAWALDRGNAGAADLASRARVLAGDAVARATIDAVQIYGGYGFVNDFPVEKLMRDARAFEALLGDERLGRVLAANAKAKE